MKIFLPALLVLPLLAQQKDSNIRGLTSVTFANLGTPSDGSIVYCSDCTQANPVAGSGSGTVARRENGAWNGGGGTTTGIPYCGITASSDNTSALTTALGSANATCYLLPNATYVLNGSSVGAANVYLNCQGSTLQAKSGLAAGMLTNTGNANFTIENCILTSTGVAGTTSLLQIYQTTGFRIINCRFLNGGSTAGKGLDLFRASGTIDNSEFNTFTKNSAIYSSQSQSVIARNSRFYSAENGMDMQGGSEAISVGNYFENMTNNSAGTGQQGNAMVCYQTSKCTFVGNSGVKISFSAFRANESTNITVTGNQFERIGDNAYYIEQPGGLGTFDTANVTISGNTARYTREGIYITNGNDANVHSVNVTGNNIAHCMGWGSDTTGAITPYVYGIQMTKGTRVTGNIVDGCVYGVVGEQGSQADANEGSESEGNSYVDKRYLSVDTTGANITSVSAGHILVVPSSATYETATKRCLVKQVATSAHLVVQCTKGYLAAADTLKDLNNSNTGTIASGGVFGPSLQKFVVTSATNINQFDRVGDNATLGSATRTGIVAFITGTTVYVYVTELRDFHFENALDFTGAPLYIGGWGTNTTTFYDYDTTASTTENGTLGTVANGVSPYCAATSTCQMIMEVPVMFNTSAPQTHPVQTSRNDSFGSYAVQPYGSHSSFSGTTSTVPASAAIVQSINGDAGVQYLSSFGTSPTFTGSSMNGTITVGTGGSTAGVYTFPVAFTTLAPDCTFSGPVAIVPTVSTTAITFTAVLTVGQKVSFICTGGR